jgi:hypothetical protein
MPASIPTPENNIPRRGISPSSLIHEGACPSSASERTIRPRPNIAASMVESIAEMSIIFIAVPAQVSPHLAKAATNGLSFSDSSEIGISSDKPKNAKKYSPTKDVIVYRMACGTVLVGLRVSEAANPIISKPAKVKTTINILPASPLIPDWKNGSAANMEIPIAPVLCIQVCDFFSVRSIVDAKILPSPLIQK